MPNTAFEMIEEYHDDDDEGDDYDDNHHEDDEDHLASDAIWVKKKPKKPKPRALFLVARKPQLKPGVGGTGRQPLNNLCSVGGC